MQKAILTQNEKYVLESLANAILIKEIAFNRKVSRQSIMTCIINLRHKIGEITGFHIRHELQMCLMSREFGVIKWNGKRYLVDDIYLKKQP